MNNGVEQLLLAITVRDQHGIRVRLVRRCDPTVRLVDVIDAAFRHSELSGVLACTGIEVIGTLQPHLWICYTDVMSDKVPR